MQNDMRDRLVELLQDTLHEWECDVQSETVLQIADHLIANGVIIPKYNVGDKVWYITGFNRTIIKSAIVKEIIINCNGVSDLFVQSDTCSFENSVDIFYPTKEQAEQELKKHKDNGLAL